MGKKKCECRSFAYSTCADCDMVHGLLFGHEEIDTVILIIEGYLKHKYEIGKHQRIINRILKRLKKIEKENIDGT